MKRQKNAYPWKLALNCQQMLNLLAKAYLAKQFISSWVYLMSFSPVLFSWISHDKVTKKHDETFQEEFAQLRG